MAFVWKRFYRNNRPLIIYGAIALVGIIGILFVLIPTISSTIALLEDAQKAKKEIEGFQSKAQTLNALDAADLAANLQVVRTAVPQDKNIASFLTTIENTAGKYGITVVSEGIENVGSVSTRSAQAKISQDEKVLGAQIVSVNAAFEGSLEQMRNFLDGVVHVRRLLRIKRFNLSFSQKNNIMRLTMVLDGFYVALPQTVGQVSDALVTLTENDKTVLSNVSEYVLMTNEELVMPGVPSLDIGTTATPSAVPALNESDDPFAL